MTTPLGTRIDDGVAWITFDNPPVNLVDVPLLLALVQAVGALADDPAARVVVLDSADAEFFLAHFDVGAILGFPIEGEPQRGSALNIFHALGERLRTMPKPTIALVEGRVGGGGAELAASCDLRYCSTAARINQMEVALGIIPGGAGTQRLARLLGTARAMEVILGSDDLDGATAERWGWCNRALPPGEVRLFVERLARRIAGFPSEAVALAKEAIHAAGPGTSAIEGGLLDEELLFQRSLRLPDAQARMRRFLDLGGQSREGELAVDELIAGLDR